jgi:guanylate kinase
MGASGSGKSTIQHSLPPMIKFLTHYATREAREGEIDGFHVRTISKVNFDKLYNNGLIGTKTTYAENNYGAPMLFLAEIVLCGTPYHATATIESIKQFKDLLGEESVVVIYIKPPDVETLRQRMLSRGDKLEDIERRIAHIYSAAELENEQYADYVVVNEVLTDAQQEVENIIFKELYMK